MSNIVKYTRSRYKIPISLVSPPPKMYDPSWHKTDPSTAAIIKLIEEKERNEAKYGDETKNWDIMRLKDSSVNETSRYVEHDSSLRPWPGRDQAGQSAAAAESPWRRGAAPGGRRGQALAESLDKRLRAEIETVEWKVNRRSNSSEERDSTRSRRRQRNSEYSKKRDRSRSVSGERRRNRRQSRSRSGSKRRERSRSREVKSDRSGSRETRRRRSVSRDRKLKKRDRQRSSSNETGKRDPSPRKHTKTTQPTPDSSATAEILSQFMTIMNNAKEKPAQNDTKKVPNHNVLPEFDPNNKGHAIVTWLIRVDDVAKLFGWNEKETLQYSLPKLVGDARTWYQTLATVPFSWAEWKKTLLEQFPCPNFAELLMEMSSRHALPTETLEQYFYAKVVLLNRCGFKGRQAVDCLVQGVETAAIRLCAHAAQFAEPEELLVYLKSAESLRQMPKIVTESLPIPETTNNTQTATAYIKTKKPVICSICSCEGHWSSKCPEKPKLSNIKKPFLKNVQMGKNQIRGPRPVYQPRMNNATIRGPRPFRPMAPGHQPRIKNNAMRGPRPLGTQPEHEYMRPVFGKKCFNCNEIGHIAIDCPEPKQKRGANAVAGASQADSESSDTQPAPPGLEE